MTAPATNPNTPPPLAGEHYTVRRRLELLVTQLANAQQSFLSTWRQINRVLFPRRGKFTMSDVNKGDRRDQDIVDNTATIAGRTAAAGIMTGTTNPARHWFELGVDDTDIAELPAVKDWLHRQTKKIHATLLKSNFYDTIHAFYGDLIVYATAAYLLDEDDEDVIRCLHLPLGQYYLANDHKGRARVFAREYPLTVRQIVEKFGWVNCSTAVQNNWRAGELDKHTHIIVHVIYENDGYDVNRLGAKFKRFKSCYYEKTANEGDKLLRESGYDEFPVMAGRWDLTDGDAYGSESPGWVALGDIKGLQFGEKKAWQAIEKVVNPPLVAHPNLKNEPISSLPGGVTYDGAPDEKRALRPLHEVRPDVDKLEIKQAQVRDRIKKAFYEDVFMMTAYLAEMSGKQPRTAAEIGVREQEKLMVLGPMLQRNDRDVYDPTIDRVFNILLRRGEIDPAPPELEGRELKVEYISIMHAAQKAGGLAQMERFMGAALTIHAAAPEAGTFDKVDVDQYLDELHTMSGVPPRVVRSDEQVAEIRAERGRAQQAAQTAAIAKDAGAAARDLSQADLSQEDTALSAMLSSAGTGTV